MNQTKKKAIKNLKIKNLKTSAQQKRKLLKKINQMLPRRKKEYPGQKKKSQVNQKRKKNNQNAKKKNQIQITISQQEKRMIRWKKKITKHPQQKKQL